MRRKYTMDTDEEEGASWLITYADMVTLLLTFFVLLLTFSTFESDKLEKALSSVVKALGIGVLPEWNRPIEIDTKSPGEAEFEVLMKAAKEIEAIKGVTVTGVAKGIKIELENPVLFTSGEANLRPSAKKILDQISNTIQKYDLKNDISISGHTDNQPIHTPEFPSNWELSTARATTVLRYLIKTGLSPDKLSASGYAEFRSISPNDTEEGRSRNRRMEILLLKRYTLEGERLSP